MKLLCHGLLDHTARQHDEKRPTAASETMKKRFAELLASKIGSTELIPPLARRGVIPTTRNS